MAEGHALRQKGQFIQSRAVFGEALELAKSPQNVGRQLACLMNIGVLSWNLGYLKESVVYYEEALSLSEKLRLTVIQEECGTAINIYRAYARAKERRDTNRHDESIQYFEEAIDLARKISSLEHELKCLRQLSLSYPQGQEEFLRLNNQALKIARKINHRREEGRCLNNIGIFYWKSSKFSKAMACLNEALLIARETDRNGPDESACLNNLGIIYRDLGDYDRALRYLKEALEIDIHLGDEANISKDLNNIGEAIRIKEGDIYNSDAFEYYKKSIDLADKIGDLNLKVYGLNNIGLIYQYQSNSFKSLEYLLSAYNISKKINIYHELSNICSNIGNAYLSQQNLNLAKQYYNEALELALLSGRSEVLWEIYFGLGKCLEHEEQARLALTYYKMAIDVIDSIRGRLTLDIHKAGFFRNKITVYESLLNLLFRMMKEDPASRYDEMFFHTAERSKARAFIEGLKETEGGTLMPAHSGVQDRLREISRKISKTISELSIYSHPEEERQEIWQRLEDEEGEYIDFLNKIRSEKQEEPSLSSKEVIPLETVQREILDHKTAILEFFLGESQSFAFIITKSDFIIKTLPGRSHIEDSLKAYLKMLSTPPEKGFRGVLAARRLYRDFLLPFEKNLHAPIEHLIVIPDGILNYLPFETLAPDQEQKNGNIRYLVESYQISYAPSVSSLAFLIQRGKTAHNSKLLLALGDPVYSFRTSRKDKEFKKYEETLREFYLNKGFDFSAIPFSKKEIKHVSRYFPRNKIDIYTGIEAKEEVVKTTPLKDYQIIHFACHGFLDEKTPYRSALVLSLDDNIEEDGFLQVREIQNLELNASLAVLSACQTGKGRLENGEGVFGLPRVFFYAGAQSTISTLWKVNDKMTADFMRHFYHFLAEGNDKAQALHLTKVRMLKSKFSHPFYWAAFVLNGDFRGRLSFN